MVKKIIFFACFILSGLSSLSYGADIIFLEDPLPEVLDHLHGVYMAKISDIYRTSSVESRAEKTVELRIEYDDYDKGLYIDIIFADADRTQDDDESSDDNDILFDHFIKINKIKEFFQGKDSTRIGFLQCIDGSFIPFTDDLTANVKWAYQIKFYNGKISACRFQEFTKNKNKQDELCFLIELTDIVRCNAKREPKLKWDFN